MYRKLSCIKTRLLMQVVDTGCGMSKVDQDKLFSLYTSINSPDNFVSEKSGLGLLLSRELCRALGGELYLHESIQGRVHVPVRLRGVVDSHLQLYLYLNLQQLLTQFTHRREREYVCTASAVLGGGGGGGRE